MKSEAQIVLRRSSTLIRSQRWRWRLVANGRIVAESGEGYADRGECIEMGKRVCSGGYEITEAF